ncbi:MAG: hypothetical protein H0U46_10535 [Actinobacteria bacterium]|nr:hypothetical protein [Actinomycetota bacterium]
MPQRIPGKLDLVQVYNDTFRGWPVKPQSRQHPIRGSFLDPRPDPDEGAIYHDGVDIAVRDDRPETGAPANRTHRVFAIEGGPVLLATPRGARGFVHAAHFGYGHIDPVVSTGETVTPGQQVGWTCEGDWHVHLSEFLFTTGQKISVNPLRPGGKLRPYVDTAPPEIHEIRFYSVASPKWSRRPTTSVALLPQAGKRLARRALFGRVDVRARVSDPQSFVGWLHEHPQLAAPHHPFRLVVTIVSLELDRIVRRREAFRAEQVLDQPAGLHFAPGTDQNLPARGGMQRHRELRSNGIYWFRLFPHGWDTTRLPDGRYEVRVRAWDVAGNVARSVVPVTIANGV